MPKLTVDVSSPPAARNAVLLRDGEPLNDVSQFALILYAEEPQQFITISRVFIKDSAVFQSTACHDIKSMKLEIEYEEA